jgi:hypothetical protein
VLFPGQQLCTILVELLLAARLLFHVTLFIQWARVCITKSAYILQPSTGLTLRANISVVFGKCRRQFHSYQIHKYHQNFRPCFPQNSEKLSFFAKPSSSGHRGCFRLRECYFRVTRNNTTSRQPLPTGGSVCAANCSPLLHQMLTPQPKNVLIMIY